MFPNQYSVHDIEQAQIIGRIQEFSRRAAEFKMAAYQLDMACLMQFAQFDQIETKRMEEELLAEISEIHLKIHADQDEKHQVDMLQMKPQTCDGSKKHSVSKRVLERELKKTQDPERRAELISMIEEKALEKKNRHFEKMNRRQLRKKLNTGAF